MEVLLWTCVLGLLSTPAGAARAELPVVFQSPKDISLTKVNSTANIQCRTSLSNPTGLYLKRRFSKKMDVLYFSLAASNLNVNPEYTHRLSVIGDCCDYTLQLSQMGVEDTDGYYCIWSKLDELSGSVKSYNSTGTIIIVRERDPKACYKTHTLQQMLFLLTVTASTLVVCVFFGVLMRWCKRTKKSYRPASRTNQGHHRLCSQHSGQHLPQ